MVITLYLHMVDFDGLKMVTGGSESWNLMGLTQPNGSKTIQQQQ